GAATSAWSGCRTRSSSWRGGSASELVERLRVLALAPQAAARGPGLVGDALELLGMRGVGWHAIDAREPELQQPRVHEQAVARAVHVGEQPPVPVGVLAIEHQRHAVARVEQALGLPARLGAEALLVGVRAADLGGVDPDEPDPTPVGEPDGVAV